MICPGHPESQWWSLQESIVISRSPPLVTRRNTTKCLEIAWYSALLPSRTRENGYSYMDTLVTFSQSQLDWGRELEDFRKTCPGEPLMTALTLRVASVVLHEWACKCGHTWRMRLREEKREREISMCSRSCLVHDRSAKNNIFVFLSSNWPAVNPDTRLKGYHKALPFYLNRAVYWLPWRLRL